MVKRRNPVVRHATILRKGGVHVSSGTRKRRRLKQEMSEDIEQYFEQRKPRKNGAESDCPDSRHPNCFITHYPHLHYSVFR